MAPFRLSNLSRHCLLASMAWGSIPAIAVAQSLWHVTDGSTLVVDSDYIGTVPNDYPLLASGIGSTLVTTDTGLAFHTTDDALHAAYARDGGSIYLNNTFLGTQGMRTQGARVVDGTLVMNAGGITVWGDNSSGIYGVNDARVSADGVSIEAAGQHSVGVLVEDGSLDLRNSVITGTGQFSAGINLDPNGIGEIDATLENLEISLRNTGYQSALQLGNGQATGTRLDITVTDNNKGVLIYNAGRGYGSLTLNDSTINTQDGDGIRIQTGKLTLNNTSVNTQSGVAVNINKTAHATIRGGFFTTQGEYADGLWIASKDSSADVSGAIFSTHGEHAHAFNGQNGLAVISDSRMSTSGAGSYGVYTDNELHADALVIDTQGEGATGVHAARGGTATLSRSTINTAGNTSTALMANAGSTIKGDNLLVNTQGVGSHGIRTRDGTLALSNSQVSTHGKDAAGLYVSGAEGSQVTLDNVRLTTDAGPAIRTEAGMLDLTLRNGTQVVGGSGILWQDMASDDAKTAVSITADNKVVLAGDIFAAEEHPATLTLSNASQLSGAVQGIDTLTLDGNSSWAVTGNSSVNQLHTNGSVRFNHDGAAFSTLSLGSLDGNGSFAMNTDVASSIGDLLAVAGTANGDHTLYVRNTGSEPGLSEEALTLVKTGGGDASFGLYGGAVDVGTYQYELQHKGDDWVLVQKLNTSGEGEGDGGEPVITPSTQTALALFNAAPTAWYGELTTLRTRMGDVRQGNQEGGGWLRMLGNETDVDDRAGVGYRQRQTGMSVGADSVHAWNDGQLITGVFGGYSRSTLDFDQGSTGTIDSLFVGGYGTWLMDSGWFVDAVAKLNRFDNKADVRMTNGEKADGSYSVPAFGVSLELGRHVELADNWYVEPSAQLSSVWIKGDSYTFSNELHAQSDSTTSHQLGFNGVIGKTLTLDNGVTVQPWLRAAAIHEFSDRNAVSINGNHFNNDLSGTRGEIGAGVSTQATKNLQVYMDARYAKGSQLESPLSASIGLRWGW